MNKEKELKLLETVIAARNANKSRGIDFAWDNVDMSLDWDDILAFVEKYVNKTDQITYAEPVHKEVNTVKANGYLKK
jgi:hypothetical protein